MSKRPQRSDDDEVPRINPFDTPEETADKMERWLGLNHETGTSRRAPSIGYKRVSPEELERMRRRREFRE